VIAIEQKLKLPNLARMIAPHPTWGELDKAAASEFSKPATRSLDHPWNRATACRPEAAELVRLSL
jgi:hypothetical protein